MKTALFTNFTDQPFTGYWNGKGRSFQAGESKHMPQYLAEHFAKHLVNRELLTVVGQDKDRNPILKYPNGDKFTSPKFPNQVPVFMELFNKAVTILGDEDIGEHADPVETQISILNKDKTKSSKQDPTEPQLIVPPDFDEEDDQGETNSFNSDK